MAAGGHMDGFALVKARLFGRHNAVDPGRSGEPLQPRPMGVSTSQYLLSISDEEEASRAGLGGDAGEHSWSLVGQPHGTEVAHGRGKGLTFG